MRTTLDIDDEVLSAAKELARQQGRSVGQVVSMLTRKALLGAIDDAPRSKARRAKGPGGFRPFPSRGSPVTNDAIDALRDVEGA